MAFENTITEQELDPSALSYVKGLRGDGPDDDLDLAVDGLSESILSRIFSLFGLGRRKH